MHLNIEFEQLKKITGSAGGVLPADFLLHRIASLELAGAGDVAVVIDRGDAAVFEAVSNEKILKTKAACVLASYEVLPGRTCVVADPLSAYQALIDFVAVRDRKAFFKDERYPHAFVSRDAHLEHGVVVEPGAVIMSGARIGTNSVLHAQSYVGIDCVIGQHVSMHPGAKILDRCVVGDYSILYAGSVVGSDGFGYQVTSRGLRKIPQIGIVRIGKHVELGANVTIDRAAFDETVIDDGAKLDNLVSIAHNVTVGKGCAILPQTCIGGSVRIGAGCLIGAQVVIRDNVVIGDRVKIVSKSGIMSNLEDGSVVAGVPAVPFTDWKRIQVITRQLPTLVKQVQQMMQRRSWFDVVVKKITSLIKR
jgi:UDP-3-O-[3-hydroxymyristoyl] glucosamine N-acyltransferase